MPGQREVNGVPYARGLADADPTGAGTGAPANDVETEQQRAGGCALREKTPGYDYVNQDGELRDDPTERTPFRECRQVDPTAGRLTSRTAPFMVRRDEGSPLSDEESELSDPKLRHGNDGPAPAPRSGRDPQAAENSGPIQPRRSQPRERGRPAHGQR